MTTPIGATGADATGAGVGVGVGGGAGGGAGATIRVLVVDDQELVRAGFSLIIDGRDDLEVVGEAGDGAEAVALTGALQPDVVLMDVRMPLMDGIEAARRIVAAGSPARIIMLTTFDLDEPVVAALRAGASGFLLKDIRPADLADAIRVVARGEALLAPSVTRRLLDRFAAAPAQPGHSAELDVLSSREVEVLALVARAMSNDEIAAELQVSRATVKTHLSSILTKLGLRDRVQAVVLAYETGLARPGDGPAFPANSLPGSAGSRPRPAGSPAHLGNTR